VEWCLPLPALFHKHQKGFEMGYKIEMSIIKDEREQRVFLHPSGCGPYVFDTEEEAEYSIRLCFADPAEKLKAKPRVVKTDEPITHAGGRNEKV
jgi:hypothetical protein